MIYKSLTIFQQVIVQQLYGNVAKVNNELKRKDSGYSIIVRILLNFFSFSKKFYFHSIYFVCPQYMAEGNTTVCFPNKQLQLHKSRPT
jgi:hypothetical protein